MMGLSGLLLTSASGAKAQLTPRARASRAVAAPSSLYGVQISSGAESHRIWETGSLGNTHRSTALEIGTHEQRQFGNPLHVVDEGGHFKGLRKDHVAVANVPGHDESAHVGLLIQ